jgi:hypothetical protein
MRLIPRAGSAAFVFALAVLIHAEPIRLLPENPHCFLFRGKAIALISSGEHYGAVLNGAFDFHRYLAAIQADGLNYTRLFGGSYVEVPGKSFGIRRNDLAPDPGQFIAPWARSNTAGYAGGGSKFDLEQWNPEYFARYRDFLADADRRGIVVEVTLFSSQYGEPQWAMSPFHPANNVNHVDAVDWKKLETLENGNILRFQESYVRKLVREANGFDNVLFEIQNEPWSDRGELADVVNPYLAAPARNVYPNSVDVADALSTAWQAEVAKWIVLEESGLPKKHLIAQNYCNFRLPVEALVPEVSLVNFHYAYAEAAAWNYGLGKAIGYDETGFLGRDDEGYRRQAWNFMLSGGSTFDALDYSFSPGHEDGSDDAPNGPGGGSAALRRQLHILREFLESLPLSQLRPDTQTVTHAGGAKIHALSNPGHDYGIYFDGNGPVEVVFSLPPGEYECSWLNPKTGDVQKMGHFFGGQRLMSPAFQNGIALRLKRLPRG